MVVRQRGKDRANLEMGGVGVIRPRLLSQSAASTYCAQALAGRVVSRPRGVRSLRSRSNSTEASLRPPRSRTGRSPEPDSRRVLALPVTNQVQRGRNAWSTNLDFHLSGQHLFEDGGGLEDEGGRIPGRPCAEASRNQSDDHGKQADVAHLSSPYGKPQHGVAKPSDDGSIPHSGFGRCDGHHKMVDFRLKADRRCLRDLGLRYDAIAFMTRAGTTSVEWLTLDRATQDRLGDASAAESKRFRHNLSCSSACLCPRVLSLIRFSMCPRWQ